MAPLFTGSMRHLTYRSIENCKNWLTDWGHTAYLGVFSQIARGKWCEWEVESVPIFVSCVRHERTKGVLPYIGGQVLCMQPFTARAISSTGPR